MTAFIAGAVFGVIFAGAICVAFVTRFQRERDLEEWDDPFADPPPLQIKPTISKRQYIL